MSQWVGDVCAFCSYSVNGKRGLVIPQLDGNFEIFYETRCPVLVKFSELGNIDAYR